MAIDFQQIYELIKNIGVSAPARQAALKERHELARHLLENNAGQLEALRNKVETAKEVDPAIRCALPLTERLDFHTPPPELPQSVTVIAADGSQIFPDRHNAVQYGLINVGAIIMRLNSGEAPIIRTKSEILFDDQLYTPTGGHITDGMLALKRDMDERSKLYELAKEFGLDGVPVVTLTDGPIELWGAADGEEASQYEESLTNYLVVLSKTQELGTIAAGYIDKPSSDPVVRLLELVMATGEDLKKLREYHPLRAVSDRWLFGEMHSSLLKPGERSAVFGFQSKSEKIYKGVLGLHFFYLNISADEKHPIIARVDIPRWVVDEPQKLSLLHAVLIQQCQIMGAKPFPYLLHRAHECAVVSFPEKNQIDQMLSLELRRTGIEMGELSGKQSAKDSSGRSSY
ncbi:MAG: DNA double-strand break repair nuclease NurA [Chloroflexota bacterium]